MGHNPWHMWKSGDPYRAPRLEIQVVALGSENSHLLSHLVALSFSLEFIFRIYVLSLFFSASCHILLKGRFIQALHHLSFPFPASSLLSSSLSWLFYGMFFSFISFEFRGSFLSCCLTLLTTPANSKFLEKSAYLNFPLKWQLIFSISEFICLSLSVHFALFRSLPFGALQTLMS